MDHPHKKFHLEATGSTSIVMKTENSLKRFYLTITVAIT